jgi:hypothetical protein
MACVAHVFFGILSDALTYWLKVETTLKDQYQLCRYRLKSLSCAYLHQHKQGGKWKSMSNIVSSIVAYTLPLSTAYQTISGPLDRKVYNHQDTHPGEHDLVGTDMTRINIRLDE